MDKLKKTGLILFLRSPEEGKVKTRIASSIGNQNALNVYHELLEHTLSLADKSDMNVFVFYDGELTKIPLRRSFTPIAQVDGDLGSRMQHAFEFVLRNHDKAIIIGSDCPYITNKDLTEAESLLESYNCVLGPALDGGYYLLGIKRATPFLFTSITWGTPTVLAETIHKLNEHQMNYYLLRLLQDIDVVEDWLEYKSKERPGDLSPSE